jgi:excisionase family DNA binding protein
MEKTFLTAEEAALLARVHVRTMNRWCKTGRVKAAQVGRRWLVDRADLYSKLQLLGGAEEGKANTLELSF